MSVTLLTPCPGARIYTGSTVTDMSSIADNALRLMTPEEMEEKLGRAFDNTKDACMAMNADGNANDAHVTGCTWIDGNGMYATFDRVVSSDIRVNWTLFLAP